MKNETAVIDALCEDPYLGAEVDEEPYPIGKVTGVRSVDLKAQVVDIHLTSRLDEVEECRAVVLYSEVDGERVVFVVQQIDGD